MRILITATAISALMIGGAFAQRPAAKPCKHTSERVYHTATGTGTVDDPYVAVEESVRVCDKGDGIAWTGDFDKQHLVPVMVDADNDPLTPDTQLVVDGKPIFTTSGNTSYGAHQHEDAQVHGINGVAVGDNSVVGKYVPASDGGTPDDTSDDTPAYYQQVDNGTAIGAGSVVEHDGSTAIGAGAKSTDTNQVTLGTKEDTIKAEGITSQKSKDRQLDGPIELVTTDQGGNLASDGGATFAAINANSAMLSDHAAQLGKIHGTLSEHAKGIAIATAMPDAWLSDKEKFAIAGGIGGFGDETALGFVAIGRIDNTWSLNAGLGSDLEFKEFGWKAGVRAGW